MITEILSTSATVYNFEGYVTAEGVTVERFTDTDGTFIRINSTLHLDRDVIQEEDGSLSLLASGGKVTL